MTREEAIAFGKRVVDLGLNDETHVFCELAIQALEQKPMIVPIATIEFDEDKLKELVNKAVLTVAPQEPKTGHWFVDERPESDREIICSNCEQPIFKYHKMDFDYRPKYCPNCGAKMVEAERR